MFHFIGLDFYPSSMIEKRRKNRTVRSPSSPNKHRTKAFLLPGRSERFLFAEQTEHCLGIKLRRNKYQKPVTIINYSLIDTFKNRLWKFTPNLKLPNFRSFCQMRKIICVAEKTFHVKLHQIIYWKLNTLRLAFVD